MLELIACAKAVVRFRGYLPQAVTFNSARRWFRQIQREDRRPAAKLLDRIFFISEQRAKRALVDQNDALLRRLRGSGLALRNVVYVQLHDAGSSSPAVLNMLRDAARLERLGCRFRDSRDALGLNKTTNELEEGALVYVDDFLGTGNQFLEARNFAIQNVVGNFSEFLLVPSICEEAFSRLAREGIEVFAGHIHTRAERPLHDNCTFFTPAEKKRLRDICARISPRAALGYGNLASMVVLYRNAPNTIPAIFRGNLDQHPFAGIFPRTSDLPRRLIE